MKNVTLDCMDPIKPWRCWTCMYLKHCRVGQRAIIDMIRRELLRGDAE